MNAAAPLPDGKCALSGSSDKTLKLWDIESGQCLRTLEGHTGGVSVIAPLPDGKRALSGSNDHTLKVWDLESGQCLRTLKGHTSHVNAVVLLSDGKRALTGSSDNTLKLWDLETGQCLCTLEGHTQWLEAVALLPDGKRALSGSHDNTLKLRDLETGLCLAAWQAAGSVVCLAAVPEVVIAGTEIGEFLFLKLMPPGRIVPETIAATWHPSRPLLAVGRANGTLLVQAWHPESQYLEELARTSLASPITRLQWSRDGAHLLAVAPDGTERILEAANLREASATTCPWSSARDTSLDGLWRAVVRDSRLEVVSTADPSPAAESSRGVP